MQTHQLATPASKHRRYRSLNKTAVRKTMVERAAFEATTVDGFPVQLVNKYLAGTTINDKYKIDNYVDKGSYGQVLSVIDVENTSGPKLVIKVMTSCSEFFEEVTTMKRIYKYAQKTQAQWHQMECPIPKVVCSGFLFQPGQKVKEAFGGEFSLSEYQKSMPVDKLTHEHLKKIGKLNPYIIMPRYKMNLADHFIEKKHKLSVSSILDLGYRVVDQLRTVHRAGYVYNDLKPDNIMLERQPDEAKELPGEKSEFENVSLHLIDFGFCTPYKDRVTGKLHECDYLKKFRGNLRYSSADQLDFLSTGRKDDLISLCYMLVYLLNRGKFLDTEGSEDLKKMDSLDKMNWAKEQKRQMTTQKLCRDRAWVIAPFVEKVFKLNFFDKPDYDELLHLLETQANIIKRRSKLQTISTPQAMRCLSPQAQKIGVEALPTPMKAFQLPELEGDTPCSRMSNKYSAHTKLSMTSKKTTQWPKKQAMKPIMLSKDNVNFLNSSQGGSSASTQPGSSSHVHKPNIHLDYPTSPIFHIHA